MWKLRGATTQISTPQPMTCRAVTKSVIPPIEAHSPGVSEARTRATLLVGAASVETAMLTCFAVDPGLR